MADDSLQLLGRYTLHGELGRGGFATVYRATDTVLERVIALKVLKPGWTDDARAVDRFMREAKLASKLKHPNIVTIFDVGQADGRLFIAMELVPGRSLQRIVAEDGPLSWPRLLAILEQTAAALDYAHKQGLIHRDIKPANIILDETEPDQHLHVVLTDFGLVRGAEQASMSTGTTGGIIGTPEYIAPEIWDGEPATKASDIYALGCVAYYLLTSKMLFGAATPVAVLKRHIEGPVFPNQWPAGTPAGAEAVLRRALAKEPTQRPALAAKFVAELRDCERPEAREQEAQRQQQAQVERATQAAAAVRQAEEEHKQREAARVAKEEAVRQAEERLRKEAEERAQREVAERSRQQEIAQTAAAEKAKRDAEARERQRQTEVADRTAGLAAKVRHETEELDRQRRSTESVSLPHTMGQTLPIAPEAPQAQASRDEIERQIQVAAEREQKAIQQPGVNLNAGKNLLQLMNISKRFPGVHALKNVHLEIQHGEIHALVGENGAGKSTLVNILSGAYPKDTGDIYWEGNRVDIHTPKDSQDLGIGVVHQEFNLVPQLSIAENVWLRREPFRNKVLHLIDRNEMLRRTRELLDELQLNLDPKRPVADLDVAQQQMVEIARAMSLNAKLMIMDEPVSALTDDAIKQVYDVIRKLKARGVSVILIPHRLVDVFEVCDRATVLRDGVNIVTVDLKNTTEDQLIQLSVGRALEQQYPKVPARRGAEALRVEGLTRKGVFRDISFSAYAGEILGIAGLTGDGRTGLIRAIFGVDPYDRGTVFVFGKGLNPGSPRSAIQAGMGLLPQDRRHQGLVLNLSVLQNVNMISLDRLTKRGLLQPHKEKEQANELISKLRIATSQVQQPVGYLNDGNQQKVVLAKWLASQSKILIFDEPTRGIDVNAKVEMYDLMNMLVGNGTAVIMVSSYMPELLSMSDRILVMQDGRLTAELSHAEATQARILTAAMGVK